MNPTRRQGLRNFALKFIRNHGSATNRQIAEAAGVPIEFIAPRVSDLVRDGLVRVGDTEKRGTRGQPAKVWIPS